MIPDSRRPLIGPRSTLEDPGTLSAARGLMVAALAHEGRVEDSARAVAYGVLARSSTTTQVGRVPPPRARA